MTYEGVIRDELIGGTSWPIKIRNVKLGIGSAVKRGTILASDAPDGTYAPATAADLNKNLAIAAGDYEAETTDALVTQAYTSGVFNREKLIPSDTGIFELALRTQNILLTSIKK